ncbi:MAG TPA: membrane protein insertion efficiency factor YidD [Acidobacteriaceae bacterium]
MSHGARPGARVLAGLVLRGYKRVVSPLVHLAGASLGVSGGCCFQPTCSEYAAVAVAWHGVVRGLWLAAARVLRCHPLSRGGWDPVPGAVAGAVPGAVRGGERLRAAKGRIEMEDSTHDTV